MIKLSIIKKSSFKDKISIQILENKYLKENFIYINIPTIWLSLHKCPTFKYFAVHLRYRKIKSFTFYNKVNRFKPYITITKYLTFK